VIYKICQRGLFLGINSFQISLGCAIIFPVKKFKIVTLGCRTNQYESAAYSEQLRALGYTPVEEGEVATVCIVNTCTVTESADSASRHQIRQLLRDHPGARVAVTGCMAESAPEALLQLGPSIELVPNQKKEELLSTLFPEEEDLPEFELQTFEGRTRAFVKVQDGCNSFCTYCIIPYVRGRSRSRSIDEVVGEVQSLIANGHKEVVLTGINVGDFDGGGTLADLVRAVDQVEGLERLRISSIDPDEVNEELQNAVLQGKCTCPSMHIVLQSGSNAILKRMNRKYTRQIFLDTVRRMVRLAPDFTVTTDIIVGFPGETEADFQETLDLVKEVRFAKVHMFPYSPRKRTRAALYPNRVSLEVLKMRKSTLLHAAEQSAFQLRESFLGRTMQVLLEEGEDKPGFLSGYTSNFLKVFVPKGSLLPNQLVSCALIENLPEGFLGEVR
jgi:threonylcarbamoyladenosine tRNA methylthiotransferase MtaB